MFNLYGAIFTISHADLLSTPSPFGNWKNPCLLEKPSPNYWKNPCPTFLKTLAQLLEKPSPNYWRSPRPTIGKTQLLATPTVENAQKFLLARKRPSPTNVTIKF